jgi:hypothetical protein
MIIEDLRNCELEDYAQLNEFMMEEGVIYNVSLVLSKLRKSNL